MSLFLWRGEAGRDRVTEAAECGEELAFLDPWFRVDQGAAEGGATALSRVASAVRLCLAAAEAPLASSLEVELFSHCSWASLESLEVMLVCHTPGFGTHCTLLLSPGCLMSLLIQMFRRSWIAFVDAEETREGGVETLSQNPS